MYDTSKIVIGIIVFIAIFTIPFWYSTLVTGEADEVPQIVLSDEAEAAGQCVENLDYMRAKHMNLLNTWRNDVVRNASRVYVSNEFGTTFDKSLTDTCLEQCHTNKINFCDQCHTYVNVEPGCWECHNIVP